MSGFVGSTDNHSPTQRPLSSSALVPSYVVSHVAFQRAPLLSNILPHLQTLVNFVTNTLPKPVLVALVYRLAVLLFAARILPTIGADSWEAEYGVDDGLDGRPVGDHRFIIEDLRLFLTPHA